MDDILDRLQRALTADEAADALRMGKANLRNLTQKGLLRTYRVSGRVFYDHDSVLALITDSHASQ